MGISKYNPLAGTNLPTGNDYRYRPDRGNAWNPLKRYPRNAACFCGSGEKHKKCCGPMVIEYCSAKKAAELERIWPDIIAGRIRVAIGDTDVNPGLTGPTSAPNITTQQGEQNGDETSSRVEMEKQET
jgi:hypothetical protein